SDFLDEKDVADAVSIERRMPGKGPSPGAARRPLPQGGGVPTASLHLGANRSTTLRVIPLPRVAGEDLTAACRALACQWLVRDFFRVHRLRSQPPHLVGL